MKFHLVIIFSLFVLQSGCEASELSSGVLADGTVSGRVNGPLTGDIWYLSGGGRESSQTFRFNLESGRRTKVTDEGGLAFPARDGKKYLLYVHNHGTTTDYVNNHCYTDGPIYKHSVIVKDARTDAVQSSFQTIDDLHAPMRVSPDGSRFIAQSSPNECVSEERTTPTVYSKDGEILRKFDKYIFSYDILADGRLVLLQRAPDEYRILIETRAGSYEFETSLSFTAPVTNDPVNEFQFIRTIRANAKGTRFLMEAVLDQSSGISTVWYRRSFVFLIDAETGGARSYFESNEQDGRLRAAEALLSPDGKWVMTTHDFVSGVVVLENNIGSSGAIITDLALIGVPPHGASYVVPVDADTQLLPPNELSESIRPVLSSTNGQPVAIGINPMVDQSWTPTVR